MGVDDGTAETAGPAFDLVQGRPFGDDYQKGRDKSERAKTAATAMRESGFECGEAVAVAEHEGEEFEGTPVAGEVAFGFGDGAEEPAEIELVGPAGDVDLVAA